MDPVRELRHDLRGSLNALKLCASVLELPLEPSERAAFLDDILRACNSVDEMMQRLESMPDSYWGG